MSNVFLPPSMLRIRPSLYYFLLSISFYCGKMRSLAQACLLLVTTITLCLNLPGLCKCVERLNCTVLQLLNVQPYPDDGLFAGFDRGLDLVPAAHLAAKEINNRSDILAGFDLQIIDIDSEACGRGTIIKGLVNVYRELVNQAPGSKCLVGVMGLPCSSVTNVLAPIIGHQNIGYVTLANSVSPAHRNIEEYPNLFHTVSSSSVHNIVLISLMQNFGWNRIGVVYDSFSIFYRTTANDFVQRAKNIEIELSVNVPITTSGSVLEAFNIINSEEARVTYWLGNDDQNALCLCEAYQREFVYPGHVFILRYNEKIMENILNANTTCSMDQLLHAMEGVLLIDYRLYVDDNIILRSGWSYNEFRKRYANQLDEYASEINESLSVNVYANSVYDQVWAYALALNDSIPLIQSKGLSLSDYTIGDTGAISSIIQHNLMNLSFQGASGWIEFNKDNEIPSFVNIFQVINGTITLVAIYDPIMQNVTFLRNVQESIPSDTFETITILLPRWLVGSIFTVQAILFCLITTNTLLLFLWRKEREIKATSPALSVLMMIGCYLLCGAPVILTLSRTVVITNITVYTFLCNLEGWLQIGPDFIFATLLIRMLRLQQIFRDKQMIEMSNYWKDKYLVIYILAICTGKVILFIVLTAIHHSRPRCSIQYVAPTHQLPHYAKTVHCSSGAPQVWLVTTLLYSGVLLFMVMLLAVMTRHIRNDVYKDTKKVNVFIFFITLLLPVAIILWFLSLESGIDIEDNIGEWLASFAISMLCQVCIFVPKLLPLAVKKLYIRYSYCTER